MSYFNYTNLGFPSEVFTSDAPDNSQSFYLPSTTQNNEITYHNDNSFGYMDQVHEPENSYLYLENGHEPSEEENDVTFYPVLNQVYVPESQIYKVVHAVEYHGTTYFYESLEYFTVYRLCHTTTYAPPHVVDGNSLDSYWPGENLPNDNEQYIENTIEYEYQNSFVESLTTENNACLSPSMNMSSFYTPELDLDTSISNTYSNASHVQTQCDLIENYYTITRSAVREENVMYGYESTVYYEQVNYGWSHLRNDLSLVRDSVQDPMQAPVLSLEALDKNAIKEHVKYRKNSMYLTALSGKLYHKETIPVVEKIPIITEVKDEYPMIDCSNKETIETNKSKVVQLNTCTTSSNKLCRRKSIRVVENLTEIEKSNHEDHVKDRSIGNFSKTLQRIDSAVRENIRRHLLSKRGKKWYEKESLQVLESMSFMKEAESKDYNGECNNGTVPKRKQDDLIVRPIEFSTTSMKMDRKGNVKRVVKMSLFKEMDEFFARTETKEISNKNHLTSETLEIPQQENTNADERSANQYSRNVGKSSVFPEERLSLYKCEDIRNNDNILQTTGLIALAEKSTREKTSLIPLSEDVGRKNSLESVTSLESENEPTKVHSQKPKKKRLENFRKFLERLLCCCTKGPT